MEELSSVIAKMGDIYGSTKICLSDDSDECLYLEPGLTEIMAESTNYTERLLAWEGWRRVVGRQIKPLYVCYVELKNKPAVLNGFSDLGDEWRARYETEDFDLYSQLEPLYKELHAYIQRKLYEVYGPDYIDLTGPLPAHLLSDMWGRQGSGTISTDLLSLFQENQPLILPKQ